MWYEQIGSSSDKTLHIKVYLDDLAVTLLNHAHTTTMFRDGDVLVTAQAIARLSNDAIITVEALAEALQYHLGPGPEYRYRALVQALHYFTVDERPAPYIDRLRQVMAEVEHFAQLP